jgi:glutamine cyclotransferase
MKAQGRSKKFKVKGKSIKRFCHSAFYLFTFALILPVLACGADAPVTTNTKTLTASSAQANSSAVGNSPTVAQATDIVPIYMYEIVNSWPHDPKAYTQGLVFYDGELFESTGRYGESSLRRVELKTGKVKKRTEVSSDCFAEGMTIFDGKIFQLTWINHKGFIYDQKSFRRKGEFAYEGEGWGLTNDGHYLILSDGTNQLRFLDPVSFQVVRTIHILDHGSPVMNLNELEYIKGEIYSNVWLTDRIARIDPHSGNITGWIDLTGLRPPETLNDSENVLNGIAYDEEHDRLFVTGKRWPKIYEIRLKKK